MPMVSLGRTAFARCLAVAWLVRDQAVAFSVTTSVTWLGSPDADAACPTTDCDLVHEAGTEACLGQRCRCPGLYAGSDCSDDSWYRSRITLAFAGFFALLNLYMLCKGAGKAWLLRRRLNFGQVVTLSVMASHLLLLFRIYYQQTIDLQGLWSLFDIACYVYAILILTCVNLAWATASSPTFRQPRHVFWFITTIVCMVAAGTWIESGRKNRPYTRLVCFLGLVAATLAHNYYGWRVCQTLGIHRAVATSRYVKRVRGLILRMNGLLALGVAYFVAGRYVVPDSDGGNTPYLSLAKICTVHSIPLAMSWCLRRHVSASTSSDKRRTILLSSRRRVKPVSKLPTHPVPSGRSPRHSRVPDTDGDSPSPDPHEVPRIPACDESFIDTVDSVDNDATLASDVRSGAELGATHRSSMVSPSAANSSVESLRRDTIASSTGGGGAQAAPARPGSSLRPTNSVSMFSTSTRFTEQTNSTLRTRTTNQQLMEGIVPAGMLPVEGGINELAALRSQRTRRSSVATRARRRASAMSVRSVISSLPVGHRWTATRDHNASGHNLTHADTHATRGGFMRESAIRETDSNGIPSHNSSMRSLLTLLGAGRSERKALINHHPSGAPTSSFGGHGDASMTSLDQSPSATSLVARLKKPPPVASQADVTSPSS